MYAAIIKNGTFLFMQMLTTIHCFYSTVPASNLSKPRISKHLSSRDISKVPMIIETRILFRQENIPSRMLKKNKKKLTTWYIRLKKSYDSALLQISKKVVLLFLYCVLYLCLFQLFEVLVCHPVYLVLILLICLPVRLVTAAS